MPLGRGGRVRSFSSTGPSYWSLDASETGERTKCPWVGVVRLIAWGESTRVTLPACKQGLSW